MVRKTAIRKKRIATILENRRRSLKTEGKKEDTNLSKKCEDANLVKKVGINDTEWVSCSTDNNTNTEWGSCPTDNNTNTEWGSCPTDNNTNTEWGSCPTDYNTNTEWGSCPTDYYTKWGSCPTNISNKTDMIENSNEKYSKTKYVKPTTHVEVEPSANATGDSDETTHLDSDVATGDCDDGNGESSRMHDLKLKNAKGKCINNDEISTVSIDLRNVTKEETFASMQGTYHQAHRMFHDNSGKQCVANSLVASVYNRIQKASTWQQFDMDKILQIGNDLYTTLQNANAVSDNYLLVTELPMVVELFGEVFTLVIGESSTGVIAKTENIFIASEFVKSLDDALFTSLVQFDACFVTFAASTFIVIKTDGLYYVFDSHSRNTDGLFVSDGTSCLLKYRSLNEVYQHCCSLAASMNIRENSQFEVTGISVQSTPSNDNVTEVTGINVKVNGIHEERNECCVEILGSTETKQNSESDLVLPSDDILVGETEKFPIHFNPLTSKSCEDLCKKFGVENKHKPRTGSRICRKEIGEPCERKVIMGDGNCFFRAVSFAISGTERNHGVIRQGIVRHLVENPKDFQGYIRPRFKSVNDYIRLSWIEKENTWATEVEILVAAHLLEIDIYTFSGNLWLKFPCAKRSRKEVVERVGIYLNHYEQCHYDVVLSVKSSITENVAMDKMVFVVHSECDRRKRHIPEQYSASGKKIKVNIDECSAVPVKCNSRKGERGRRQRKSDYMRGKRLMKHEGDVRLLKQSKEDILEKERNRYKQNEGQKTKVKCASKRKYAENEEHKSNVKKHSRMKYAENEEHMNKVKSSSREKYAKNEEHMKKVKSSSRKKYAENEGYMNKVKASSREKYAGNEEHMKKVKARSREKYAENEEHMNKVKACSREKYAENEEHMNKVKACSREKYAENEEHMNKVKACSREKYAENQEHMNKVKARSREKYAENEEHMNKVKACSRKKYAENEEHMNKLKASSRKKYAENEEYMKKVKANSKDKYEGNEQHKAKVKSASKSKYSDDAAFKSKTILYNVNKYKVSEEYRKGMQAHNKARALQKEIGMKSFNKVKLAFEEEIKEGPEYVCSVCCRRLFLKQVIECRRAIYEKKGQKVNDIARKCISESNLHKCSRMCDGNCVYREGAASILWICHTCHRKILCGKLPAEAAINNLALEPIPSELECLNNLEEHLIALHIPFMKVLSLPKGGQKGCHGPVVCVPANIEETTNVLPKGDGNDHLIKIKLKRKLTYKGHYKYHFVRKSHIMNALEYLKGNNRWYKDVKRNDEWINPLPPITEEDNNIETDSGVSETMNEDDKAVPSEIPIAEKFSGHEESESGLLMDTCLQPVDIGQEVLDQHFDTISCLAPAESNTPVHILQDKSNEAKSFPFLFPTGRGTFHESREEKLTLAKYLSTRLMNADRRFARNTDYIFYGQYLSELAQVISNVSIALRKSLPMARNRKITKETLTDVESLRTIFHNDEGYKFLRPIRGTPPFWQCVQKDLFAMIRQLGIPTWFCSFSSADTRWTEIIEAILKEEGNSSKANELDWSEKCAILRKNPVTAARMFDQRFQTFLKKVILSPAQPIGNIIDWFYRVEFQQRGSPHTHCLFWVQDAPKIDVEDDDIVTAFVDQYVSCELPKEDDDLELHAIVNSVQKHSKSHSKSCKKGGTNCRFNFPRPPTGKSFVCHSGNVEAQCLQTEQTNNLTCDPNMRAKVMTKEEAKSALLAIWKKLSDKDESYESVDKLFQDLNISQEFFEEACCTLAQKTSIYLKRAPQDVWINQYNPDLLRCWNANMDIQYIVDAYSCVVYIISYISKAEREMGLLLSHAEKEATKYGNNDAKLALKRLGHVYLHNREISVQEAIFRVCHMKLKEGSRKVQFIPTGPNPIRMSKPLQLLKLMEHSPAMDEGDIWMTSIIDRYMSRPIGGEFDDMCLATFCSEYRVLSSAEISRVKDEKRHNPVVELQHGLGFVQKRSRSDPAVVRYPRFSQTKDPEKYYHSNLQLFLPHRCDKHLKPSKFISFENFYVAGAVRLGYHLQTVKSVVDSNRNLFEKEGNALDNAGQFLETADDLQDAWAQICPETELGRLECLETLKEREDDDDKRDSEGDIPDLLPKSKQSCFRSELAQNVLSRGEAYNIMRSLNEEQSKVFYKVRQWCLQKRNGEKPEPFHVFLTGGAGTGKSHLIKAIYYEASRLLAPMLINPDDVSVLLTAPTGVAAFNIGASTIHSALSIGIDAKLPYVPLGEEKMNTLRAKLGSIEVMIIDEISMVDKKLLAYVHGRLRQIKKTGDYSPFGKVSMIAVGDFYQLPPVKGKSLYVEDQVMDLWNDYFKIAELCTIMRQKDSEFAEMLNRLRTRKKHQDLLPKDIEMLSQCETGEESNAIHIFARNDQVDEFNVNMLHAMCQDPITIESEDYSRNHKTGKLEKRNAHHAKVYRTTLAMSLTLGVGARVLVTKNIDVGDGLVNGVFGTISLILFGDNKKFPRRIFVVFDDEKVGQKTRKKDCSIANLPERSTAIEPQEDVVANNGGVRRQFPLKLAWACTVHKVQGLTVKEAVVSLDKIFAPGQAYVALSRITSIEGLTIQSFKESVIYCNEKVNSAMISMPRFIPNEGFQKRSRCCMILHNIEGLASHIEDIRCDKRFLKADVICVTETWLCDSHSANVSLEGFAFHGRSRQHCYKATEEMFSELQSKAHGGIGFYFKNDRSVEILQPNVPNVEYVTFYEKEQQLTVTVMYRPPSYNVTVFRRNLRQVVDEGRKKSSKMIIMGDFNEDALNPSSIATCLEAYGFNQHVSHATTECGTRIDHVYVRGVENVITENLPTYFSFHEAIVVNF